MKIVITLFLLVLSISNYKAQQAVGNFIYLDEYSEPMFFCSIDSVSCAGQENGSIVLSGFNNHISSYTWSNGSTDSVLLNLSSGEYTLSILTDFGTSYDFTFNVGSPQELKLELNLQSNRDEISIHSLVSGGISPYQFQWSTGDDTERISISSAGLFTCEITDAHGCSVSDNIVAPFSELDNNALFDSAGLTYESEFPLLLISPEISIKNILKIDGGIVEMNVVNETSFLIDQLSSGYYLLVYEKNNQLDKKLLVIH